jgi:hypothetical protein
MLCGYILSFSISEGPVFLGYFYQVDKCILASQAETFFQTIRYHLVKSFFLLNGPPLVERDLNEYAIFGSLNSEISGIENEAFGRMLCHYLEAVVTRDVQGFGHRFVDYLADGFSIFGWLALGEINSDERHGGVLFRLGVDSCSSENVREKRDCLDKIAIASDKHDLSYPNPSRPFRRPGAPSGPQAIGPKPG